MSDKNHWASFDMSGSDITIRVTTDCGGLNAGNINGQINRDKLRHPRKSTHAWGFQYDTTSNNNRFTFTLYNPDNSTTYWSKQFLLNLYEATGLSCYERQPVFFFVNPENSNTGNNYQGCPAPSSTVKLLGSEGAVTLIDPNNIDGETTNEGKQHLHITPSLGYSEYCIKGGAYVKGRITVDGIDNVKITGRGILSGLDYKHNNNGTWDGHLIFGKSNANTVTVEGITITDSSRGGVEILKDVIVKNVKVMGWHVNTDGVLGSDDSVIEDVFVKVNDDAIKITASDIDAKRIVAWQQTDGSVVQLSWNLFNLKENSSLDKLALIGADNTDLAGNNANPLNSSIISLRNMMAGKLRNFTFNNIDADVTPHSFAIIQLEDDLVYGDNGRKNKLCYGPGDFTADNPTYPPTYSPNYNCHLLDGDGRIENLVFSNVDIEGVPNQMMVFDKRLDPMPQYRFDNTKIPSFYRRHTKTRFTMKPTLLRGLLSQI